MDFRDELDERFLRRQWLWQRVGWGAMGLVILASVLGFLGTSPLTAQVESRDVEGAHYEVEYARWTRYQHLDRMHVRVDAPAASGDELKLAFSREWVENNNLRSSTPDSDGGGASADGAVYSYLVEDWSEPIVVALEFEPRKSFRNPGELTVTAGESAPVKLPLWSWVHP